MAVFGEFLLEIIDDLFLALFVFSQLVFIEEKRKGFYCRIALAFPVYAVIAGVKTLLFSFDAVIASNGGLVAVRHFLVEWEWMVVFVAVILYMLLCFRCSWNLLLMTSLAGLCTQQLMYALWAFAIARRPALDTPAFKAVAFCVIGICFSVALYYFLTAKITQWNLKAIKTRSVIALIPLYILAAILMYCSSTSAIFLNMLFDTIQQAVGDFSSISYRLGASGARYASLCTNAAANLLILISLKRMLYFSQQELERELLEQIREQDRKQYARFRDNVDYINTKSHDLKHYLSLLQGGEKLPARELRQVSESISNLDAETDSGNETLDLILTDRRLSCQRRGVELIFQTDGTRLEQLDVIDTYAIFCNILDNAVEYAAGLPEGERQIQLGIRTIHGMVFIHQENPLNGTLDMEDGLPVTTQGDPLLHGFGLKSVQSTVKKRGGELAIRAENGRFELDICFPRETIEA